MFLFIYSFILLTATTAATMTQNTAGFNADAALELLIKLILVPGLLYIGAKIKQLIDAKIAEWLAATSIKKKEDLRAAIADAEEKLSSAAYKAVMETQETFVNDLKAAGEFDATAAAEAFNRSFTRIKEIMSNAAYDVLQTATGAVDARIKAEIYALLPDVKQATAAAATNTKKCKNIGFSFPPNTSTPAVNIGDQPEARK